MSNSEQGQGPGSIVVVAADTSTVTLLPADALRRSVEITNKPNSAVMYVKFGAGAASDNFDFILAAGQTYVLPSGVAVYTGIITAAWAAAIGGGTASHRLLLPFEKHSVVLAASAAHAATSNSAGASGPNVTFPTVEIGNYSTLRLTFGVTAISGDQTAFADLLVETSADGSTNWLPATHLIGAADWDTLKGGSGVGTAVATFVGLFGFVRCRIEVISEDYPSGSLTFSLTGVAV